MVNSEGWGRGRQIQYLVKVKEGLFEKVKL